MGKLYTKDNSFGRVKVQAGLFISNHLKGVN
jgi:hypothetical protein